MASPAHPLPAIRFGPFELDASSGELRKSGLPVKLHPQPLRVLLLLIENRGQVVAREEIQDHLWHGNTFVDFEGGINFCIKQIRDALADSAEKPRYVETLPRRGYRFIAQVTTGETRGEATPFLAPTSSRGQPAISPRRSGAIDHDIHVVEMPAHLPGAKLSLRMYALAFAGLLCLMAIVASPAIFHMRGRPKLTEKDSIVLADFANHTSDPVLDSALKQGLSMELAQSPFLNILSDTKIRETMGMMGRSPEERVTSEEAREICLRTGSKAVLSGEISQLGNRYLVNLNAVACSNGDTLAREQVVAESKEEILSALSRGASDLRKKLGESLPSVQKFDVPIEATTTSLEALENYNRASKAGFEQGDAHSIPFLKRAIELDPHFAMAYAALARRYSNLDEPSLSLLYARKAYELRDRVTERERFDILASYYRATGDLENMSEMLEQWKVEYPRDSIPHGSLCANYALLGQVTQGIEECRQSLLLNPENSSRYTNLGGMYLEAGRLDDAQSLIEEAAARHLDSGGIREIRYHLAFLRRDSAGMQQQVNWSMGWPGDENGFLALQADTEAYEGHLESARQFSQHAVDSAERGGFTELAELWNAVAAMRETEFGNPDQARKYVENALHEDPGRDVKVYAALVLARLGDAKHARMLVQKLKEENPSNTSLRIYWIPVIDGAIELADGKAPRAIAALQSAEPYELGLAPSLERGTLYDAYLRGLAYAQLGDGLAAAREFEKIVNNSGVVINFLTAPLARYQLARAYAIAGNPTKAKAAYEDLFTIWRDADSDLQLLQKARLEYAKLRY